MNKILLFFNKNNKDMLIQNIQFYGHINTTNDE